MPTPLYLDTARLGRMTPSACRASIDFARLASEHGSTLYFDELLRDGSDVLPASLAAAYPGLSGWSGIVGLKGNLRQLTGSKGDAGVLVASRSASVMRIAARLLCKVSRNVLVTDLSWQSYARILSRHQRHTASRSTLLRLRQRILVERLRQDEVVELIANHFLRHQCDGLFLPLVDNLGIRLPLNAIVERIRAKAELRFVAVDGAQAINHIPLKLAADHCDFFIGGCHKWLGAFTPMGVGLFGHPRTREFIGASLQRWLRRGLLDDPLLNFTNSLETGQQQPFGETVAVAPLFTAHAAIQDALETKEPFAADRDRSNRQLTINAAAETCWQPVTPVDELQSRILLLKRSDSQPYSAESIRRQFLGEGIAVTAYESQLVRLSLPTTPFTAAERSQLRVAFH